jgi:hypothetical protein
LSGGTLTGKLEVDVESGTGLEVTGGEYGGNIAEFIRDIGGTGTIGINSNGAHPQMYFAGNSNTFAIGTHSTSFKISDNSAIGTNDRLTIDGSGNATFAGNVYSSGTITCDGNLTTDAGTLKIEPKRESTRKIIQLGHGASGSGTGDTQPYDVVSIRGHSIDYSGGTRLTNTGFLHWHTGGNWTGGERQWALTNGYNMGSSPRFSLLYGNANSVFPSLGENGALGTNTNVACYWANDGSFYQNGNATFAGDVLPSADSSKDLGSSALRWDNIHVGDLHVKEINAQQQEDLNIRMDQGYELQYDGTEVAKVGHTHSYLPLSGGTLTGIVYTDNGGYFQPLDTGGNSGMSGTYSYGWGYQEAGAWSHPFPDIVFGYHTGMKFGGYYGYGGCRFYNDHPSRTTTEIFSVGNGDNDVRVQYDLHVGNDLNVSAFAELGEGFNADGDSTLTGDFSMQGDLDVSGSGTFSGQIKSVGSHPQFIIDSSSHSIMDIDAGSSNSLECSVSFKRAGTEKWKIGMDNAPSAEYGYFIIKRTNNSTSDFFLDTAGDATFNGDVQAVGDIQTKGDYLSADGSAGITCEGQQMVAIVDDRGDAHELTFKNGLLIDYQVQQT